MDQDLVGPIRSDHVEQGSDAWAGVCCLSVGVDPVTHRFEYFLFPHADLVDDQGDSFITLLWKRELTEYLFSLMLIWLITLRRFVYYTPKVIHLLHISENTEKEN